MRSFLRISILVGLSILVLFAVYETWDNAHPNSLFTKNGTTKEKTLEDNHVLHVSRRRLPGGFDFDIDHYELDGVAAGFVAGLLFAFFLLALLCCCCCGGRGCSIWDVLACVCIYELCCDDVKVGDFQIL